MKDVENYRVDHSAQFSGVEWEFALPEYTR